MPLTVADIMRWDAGAIRQVSDAARTRAQISLDTAQNLESLPGVDDWTGRGADAAKQRIDQMRRALMVDARQSLAISKAADVAANNVEIVKDNLENVWRAATELGLALDPASGTIGPGPGLLTTRDVLNISELQQALNQVLQQAEDVDKKLADAMHAADDKVPVPPEAHHVPMPPPGASAEEVNQWWKSLAQEDKDQLIAQHPPELGNLNGIPAEVRDQINQAVMHDDLNRVTNAAAQHGVSVEDVLNNPTSYGLTETDVVRYHNADQTIQGLGHNRGPEGPNQRPVMLWAYDPLAFNGQGRAAIAIGNPDKSQNTAVIVPGTSASVADGWLHDGHNDAINMYDQAMAAHPGESTAVIAWMGYDSPDSFNDPRIGSPWLARDGGERLAADVNSLWVTHSGEMPQHVTVLGHSYGSTTVADAFAGYGMHANDAILIGSPGTDLAKSAADFHLDGGNVYVGAASTDPVSWIGQSGTILPNVLNDALGNPVGMYAGLGVDPAGDSFGSIRFRAEVTGSGLVDIHDHSHYYDLGSESLHNMTQIATGHGSALGSEGMLADGRRQPHVSTPSQIDVPILGPIHLPEIGFDIPGTPAFLDPEAERPSESVTNDHQF